MVLPPLGTLGGVEGFPVMAFPEDLAAVLFTFPSRMLKIFFDHFSEPPILSLLGA